MFALIKRVNLTHLKVKNEKRKKKERELVSKLWTFSVLVPYLLTTKINTVHTFTSKLHIVLCNSI